MQGNNLEHNIHTRPKPKLTGSPEVFLNFMTNSVVWFAFNSPAIIYLEFTQETDLGLGTLSLERIRSS
jgi:hypothetical protein